MIGRLANSSDPRVTTKQAFAEWLEGLEQAQPITVMSHFDADGLSAAAILVRALERGGRKAEPLVLGKGETPWDDAVCARLEERRPAGLILSDLGTKAEPVLPGLPTAVIDHHVPTGEPQGAITLSGNGLEPEPTTSLLAYWAVQALGEQDDLLWLAAIGAIGDMADEAAFPEVVEAQKRYTKTALRDAVSLVNAPRRTAAADASPALHLLLTADGPKAISKGDSAEAQALRTAKAEVREAMETAKRTAPIVLEEVALIPLDSACQIHPLMAQQWRGRLKDKVVIAANRGYRPGWVHFAARSATGRNLIEFLAQHRPDGADSRYGNGHAQATGGALPLEQWNSFISGLGFPQAQVHA